tara:strand:- start:169 stop:393 length:225 start_codon:yes stop_codon:yes gene_type:complete
MKECNYCGEFCGGAHDEDTVEECPMKGRGAQCAVNGECFHKYFSPPPTKSPITPEMTEQELEEADIYPRAGRAM